MNCPPVVSFTSEIRPAIPSATVFKPSRQLTSDLAWRASAAALEPCSGLGLGAHGVHPGISAALHRAEHAGPGGAEPILDRTHPADGQERSKEVSDLTLLTCSSRHLLPYLHAAGKLPFLCICHAVDCSCSTCSAGEGPWSNILRVAGAGRRAGSSRRNRLASGTRMCLMRSSCSIGSRVRAITCACDDRKLPASVGVLRELERHAMPVACHRWLCGQAPALV